MEFMRGGMRERVEDLDFLSVPVVVLCIVAGAGGGLDNAVARTSGVRVLGWDGGEDGRMVPVSLEVEETVIVLDWGNAPCSRNLCACYRSIRRPAYG